MSEKFGLNWKEYDATRIQYMMAVMNAYVERQKIEHNKLKYG